MLQQSIASSREGIFTPSYELTKCSTATCFVGENSSNGPEQLQMLQLKKQAEHCIIKRRDIYTKLRTHKVNSCFGQEQLQMLHVGQNSCKSFSYKSKIGGRALHHQEKGYLQQANSCKSQSSYVGQCYARACQPATQYNASIVQCCAVRFFSTTEQVYTENQFFYDELFCLTLMLVLSVKMVLSPRSCK